MSTKELLTQGRFATLVGVKQPSISEAVRRGRLRANEKGLIDPADELSRRYIEKHPYQRRRKDGRSKSPRRKLKGSASARGRKPKSATRSPGTTVGGESYAEAERREKVANANLKEMRLRQGRGELVLRADVHRVFAHLYAVHSSQLKTLADKLGPDVAAAFKLTDADTPRIQEIMSMEMLRALSQIKSEMNDYLDTIGDEELVGRSAVKRKSRPAAKVCRRLQSAPSKPARKSATRRPRIRRAGKTRKVATK